MSDVPPANRSASGPSGGELVARILSEQGVRWVFTLCGGHISPILVASRKAGIRVVDVRDEASAVFAADAAARLTGRPGVAAVTAGPGLTNTITALKNAQLAESPLLLLGGATAGPLRGRGALQDIEQLPVVSSSVKWATRVRRLRDLAPTLAHAVAVARDGVPGPVFVECPVDLLYGEAVVREWFGAEPADPGRGGLAARLQRLYLKAYVERSFAGGAGRVAGRSPRRRAVDPPARVHLDRAAALLHASERPLMLVGSQALLDPTGVERLRLAMVGLGLPVYLSGMARGLLGPHHDLLLRHRRKQALREADLVLLVGVSCDFRLGYGRHIGGRAKVVGVNRGRRALRLNRRPTLGAVADPATFLSELASRAEPAGRRWAAWIDALRRRDAEREREIEEWANRPVQGINPLALCQAIERRVDANGIIVADGGDFVATASYILRPRGPLSWLDPGVFGTLGVGGGFALAAKLCRPEDEVWLIWGDGSSAYSLAEFDTFARHGLPVIAVVGNDAGWTQIARDQLPRLGDDVGTVLRPTSYEIVARGYGGEGLLLENPGQVDEVLTRAQQTAARGTPVLINARIGKTDFREGSISI